MRELVVREPDSLLSLIEGLIVTSYFPTSGFSVGLTWTEHLNIFMGQFTVILLHSDL